MYLRKIELIVRKDINVQLKANAGSINLLKKTYEKTGKIDHPIMNSLKDKIIDQLKKRPSI